MPEYVEELKFQMDPIFFMILDGEADQVRDSCFRIVENRVQEPVIYRDVTASRRFE